MLDRHHPAKFFYESTFLEWAHDTNNAWWQRISFLAYSRSRANGHASFARGEIAAMLGTSRQQVSKAITVAVRNGWLDNGSHTRCLVVPSHIIRGGANNGNESDPCVVCGAGRKVPKPRVKKSPPIPADLDSRTPAACPSDADRAPEGERVGVKCKVRNCDGRAATRELCDYCQKVELVVYEREPDRERARLRMDHYVAQGDPQRMSYTS